MIIPDKIHDKDQEELAEFLTSVLKPSNPNLRIETKSITHIVGDIFQTILLIKNEDILSVASYLTTGGYVHKLECVRILRYPIIP